MDLGLTGKVAMVAGASRGLGYAVGAAARYEGARVSMGSRDAVQIGDAGTRIAGETGADVLAVRGGRPSRGVADGLAREDGRTIRRRRLVVRQYGWTVTRHSAVVRRRGMAEWIRLFWS